MKMPTSAFLLLAIYLCLASISALGQESPKPVLIDEMLTRGGNCEELLARLDNYFVELSNNPADSGYVVIYQEPSSRAATTRREWQVKNHTRMRRFDMSRVTMVIGSVRNDATVQFWRIPTGAELPEILTPDAEFTSAEPEADPYKPYIYATEFADGIPGCDGPVYDLEAYAEVLKENDGNRGNIVIGETSQAKFRAREREIFAELKGLGIERTRIRTFYKKVAANTLAEYTELWVLPAKPALVPRSPDRFTVIGNMNIEPPPSPPAPTKVPEMVSGGVLNGKAISLVKPAYPAEARRVGASGTVQVEIVIDKQGNVISAKAVGGHEALRAASEAAARASKFYVTSLSGQPVKVRGILVYNFAR